MEQWLRRVPDDPPGCCGKNSATKVTNGNNREPGVIMKPIGRALGALCIVVLTSPQAPAGRRSAPAWTAAAPRWATPCA